MRIPLTCLLISSLFISSCTFHKNTILYTHKPISAHQDFLEAIYKNEKEFAPTPQKAKSSTKKITQYGVIGAIIGGTVVTLGTLYYFTGNVLGDCEDDCEERKYAFPAFLIGGVAGLLTGETIRRKVEKKEEVKKKEKISGDRVEQP